MLQFFNDPYEWERYFSRVNSHNWSDLDGGAPVVRKKKEERRRMKVTDERCPSAKIMKDIKQAHPAEGKQTKNVTV